MFDQVNNARYFYFMNIALQEADKGASLGEVPVGALIVKNNVIISKAHNEKEITKQPLMHAEIIAIMRATEKIGDWRLNDTELYVTLEPCAMCSGAIVHTRIPHVIYGATAPKAGCAGTLYNLLDDDRFNHKAKITKGILREFCEERLKVFFKKIRLGK